MDRFTIRRPDDFHVHFRKGQTLNEVAPFTARVFGRALVMPNTNPPILNSVLAKQYYYEIGNAFRNCDRKPDFAPLMLFRSRMKQLR